MPQQTPITIRIEPEQQKKLDVIATQLDRSRNWVAKQAISDYLDVYQWQTAKIEQALKDSECDDAVFYTSKEIDELIDQKFSV